MLQLLSDPLSYHVTIRILLKHTQHVRSQCEKLKVTSFIAANSTCYVDLAYFIFIYTYRMLPHTIRLKYTIKRRQMLGNFPVKVCGARTCRQLTASGYPRLKQHQYLLYFIFYVILPYILITGPSLHAHNRSNCNYVSTLPFIMTQPLSIVGIQSAVPTN